MKSKIFILVYFLLFLPSSCYPIRYDGPYKGKVVDAETGKPIEGVVVLGVWYKETPTVAGAVGSYYDAMETTTDRNGEFKIAGLGLKILSNIEAMSVLIFKSGYEYFDPGLWDSLKEDVILKEKIKWDGNKAIIPLKKFTMEERKKSSGPPDPPSEAPFEKVQRMLKELDKDRIEQGLSPRGLWNGVHYE